MFSCSDSGFSETGLKFLEKGFSYGNYGAKDYMTKGMSYSKKEEFREYLEDLRDDFHEYNYKFTYHNAITFEFIDIWGNKVKCADAYYSFNDNKKYIICLEFSKKDGNWGVDDLAVYEPKDLIDEYSEELENLEAAKKEGKKDKIKEFKESLKDLEPVIKSFEDFYSKSEFEEFKKLKNK